MQGAVTDRDFGYKAFVKALALADDKGVTIGVQGQEATQRSYADAPDMTNVGIAATQELGDPLRGIPRRSFLRDTVDANQDKYGNLAVRGLKKWARTKGAYSIEKVFGLLGVRAVADVKNRMVNFIPPPLKPATVRWRARHDRKGRRKGKEARGLSALGTAIMLTAHFKPLIDTSTLKNSVTYKVGRRKPEEVST